MIRATVICETCGKHAIFDVGTGGLIGCTWYRRITIAPREKVRWYCCRECLDAAKKEDE
jgi:hypothetical protein